MSKHSKKLAMRLHPLYVFAIICFSYVHADYCSCKKHILCLYPRNTPGPQCKGYISNRFTETQKKKIIEKINKYRSRVATGRENMGGGQPSAANMLEVTWDDFLMKTSQRWADQCKYTHSNSKCRIADDKSYFGENLAIRTYSSESLYKTDTYLDLIKAWYDEVKDFPPELVDQYVPRKTTKKIGHYAQLVNGATYRVGCGQTRYKGTTYLVCHFKGGVYSSLPLYKKGFPASKCPPGCIASRYEGLCALEKYSTASMIGYSKVLLSFLSVLQIYVSCFWTEIYTKI